MENSEPTRTCGQCHKDVAEVNFALHETHCSRFLCLCPDCGEAVPRDQLREHREEQHSLVRCSKCNQKMERCLLQDHELEKCVERLQSCEFCELPLPFKELDKHSLFCGSRTEHCPDCGRYVKLREQSEHHLTCSASDDNDGKNPSTPKTSATKKQTASCSFCMGSFPVGDIDKHELDCMAARGGDNEEEDDDDLEDDDWEDTMGAAAPFRVVNQHMSMSGGARRTFQFKDRDKDDVNQISNCRHCDLALPVVTLRWHQAKCQTHILLKKNQEANKEVVEATPGI